MSDFCHFLICAKLCITPRPSNMLLPLPELSLPHVSFSICLSVFSLNIISFRRSSWSYTDCCYCLVAKLCLTLCNPMVCSMPGFPVLYYLLEFAQIHVHWVSDAIQPSHLLLSPSPPAFNLSQHQDLFQWVSSLHQVAQVLGLQLPCFQWIFRVDFL